LETPFFGCVNPIIEHVYYLSRPKLGQMEVLQGDELSKRRLDLV
jgi:hypothetical protein